MQFSLLFLRRFCPNISYPNHEPRTQYSNKHHFPKNRWIMPQYAYSMESRLFPVFLGGDGARNCSQQPTKRRRKRPNPLEFDKPAPRLLLRLTACKCTTLRKRVWREERRCCREVWKEGTDGRESATLWLVYTVMAGSPQCVD